MLSKELFLRLPRACVINNAKEQTLLYPENLTPFQMKFVLAILAQANMNNGKPVENFDIFLQDFKSQHSLFSWVKTSMSKVIKAIEGISHPFIKNITCADGRVNVTVSQLYKKLIVKQYLGEKPVNIELEALMAYKKVSSIKLHIQTKAFYPYRANFYFLIEFLGVSTNQCRKEQIRSIKNKIRTVNNVADFKYQHPVEISAPEKEGDYDFSIFRLKDGLFPSDRMMKRKPGKRNKSD
ncbi:hypothetical protein MEG05_03575 [Vibrio aestuarianus]|uniref:hypothetical protein n=1 Tax=Vibrio aestuarianus TaxID=28171 RepID=UPI00237C9D66|nr:hypothetical protein [Vibrio aestuarianus]MDE1313379.1 hypothetical protein [Vibrio aestuarianus]